MTIAETSKRFGISPETLRYYERVGAIPPVTRTPGGTRDYQEQDLAWVGLAVCMRGAGLPIEVVSAYSRLFQQGDETIPDRLALLERQMETLRKQEAQLHETMQRLDYKISRYRAAVETGRLTWEK